MQKVMRRRMLTGATAAMAFGLVLTGCAGPTGGGAAPEETTAESNAPAAEASANNPFGVAENSTVDLVVFNGGYGIDYAKNAAEMVEKNLANGTKVNLHDTVQISAELQPRFVSKTPPDVFNNDGAQSIAVTSLLNELATLDELFETENYDGVKIADAVYPGVKESGVYDGKFIYANYVMTAFGLWYSQSLFDEMGLEAPKTWDDLDALCTAAKADGKYLFVFGKEAAPYWSWLVLDAAIKQEGTGVINDISNLKEGAWSNASVQDAITRLKKLIDDGCFVPGGSGTQFTQAQAQWSNDKNALMYFSGSWIENEMKEATADDFQMKFSPVPLLADGAAMPFEAIQAGPAGQWTIPADAANAAGGKEFLRAMYSKEAAAFFSENVLTPTVVKDTVPEDGFGSTALASTVKGLADAGENTWAYVPTIWYDYYGIDMKPVWNSFLDGQLSVADFTAELEKLNAAAASDPDKTKNEFNY